MTEPQTIPVHEPRLRSLERDHTHLEQIQSAAEDVSAKKKVWQDIKDELTKAKKDLDVATTAMLDLIVGGPPKDDPQRKLPFLEESERKPSSEHEPIKDESTDADAEVLVPVDVQALDISPGVKKALAKAGVKCLSDVIDLGNGNWPKFPKGFASVEGIGPKAISKLAQILPASVTAPPSEKKVETKRIKILTFSAGNGNLEPGSEYDATILEGGEAIVQLPGTEPVQFHSYEFEVVETAS